LKKIDKLLPVALNLLSPMGSKLNTHLQI